MLLKRKHIVWRNHLEHIRSQYINRKKHKFCTLCIADAPACRLTRQILQIYIQNESRTIWRFKWSIGVSDQSVDMLSKSSFSTWLWLYISRYSHLCFSCDQLKSMLFRKFMTTTQTSFYSFNWTKMFLWYWV